MLSFITSDIRIHTVYSAGITYTQGAGTDIFDLENLTHRLESGDKTTLII